MKAFLQRAQEALISAHPEIASFFVHIEGVQKKTLPFLPIGVFRRFHVFQHKNAARSFLSSGSTNDTPARHSFSKEGIALYARESVAGFREFLSGHGVSEDTALISLVPKPQEWPHSSLAAMIDMFQKAHMPVFYGDDCPHKLSGELILFGTSFHHVASAQKADEKLNALIAGKDLLVVDTGGTKGRTRAFSSVEMQALIQKAYAASKSCRIVSEYGMCELGSQAWSLHVPHDGWFRCNKTLSPLLVDLDKGRVITDKNTVGFLAFVDRVNQDSYGAIITEDLAMMDPAQPDCFKLVGRAPDASMKGCSLNVKDTFLSSNTHQDATEQNPAPQIFMPKPLLEIASLVSELPSDVWSKDDIADLSLSLQSIKAPLGTLPQTRAGQNLLFVLSANIPITFVYPALMARFLGAAQLRLLLPSIRLNDPASERVRAQITSLAQALQPFLAPLSLIVHHEKDLDFSLAKSCDAVLIFGSDESIQTFQHALSEQVEIIGLGDVMNAYLCGDASKAQELAEICTRWLGRGCLTPIALVVDDPQPGFMQDFARQFDARMHERLQASGLDSRFFHRHALLELESLLRLLGESTARIVRGKSTAVVDLRGIQHAKLSACNFPLRAGGCGLVFMLSQEQRVAFPKLKGYGVEPGLFDAHTEKTWQQWLA